MLYSVKGTILLITLIIIGGIVLILVLDYFRQKVKKANDIKKFNAELRRKILEEEKERLWWQK